jgi:hypothetical protein
MSDVAVRGQFRAPSARQCASALQSASSGLGRVPELASELHATRIAIGVPPGVRMDKGDGPGRDRTSARGFEVRRSIH